MSLKSIESSTLLSLGTTATDFVSDNTGRINAGAVKSLFTASVTTSTTSLAPDTDARINATRDYVSTMSIQEIDQMLVEIDEQENQIINAVDNAPKVKTLGSRTKF